MARKRRKFSSEFKLDTVVEGMRGEKTIAQLCRERDITESLYYTWRDNFKERALEIFEDQRKRREADDSKDARIAELERMVGRLTMEVEVLKKARTWLDTQRGKNGR